MTWIEKSLDQLGTVSRGRSRHRPRDAAHLYGGAYPFVQTSDVKHAGLYLYDYEQTYSEAGLEQSKLWSAGTLCITIAANIADTSILGIDACFPDSVIGFVAEEKKADTRFIKYLFDARLKKKYQTFSQGVAQDNLSQEKLLSIRFKMPEDVQEQSAIADILAGYDHLVFNNKQRISILKRAAQLLFEEWFVRFRYPGHENHKLVKGIPLGWSTKPLEEVASLRYGKALKEENRISGSVDVYGSSGVVGSHNVCLIQGPGIIVGRKGNVGSVFWSSNDFWPIDTTYYVEPKQVSLFVYHMLLAQYFTNSDAAVPGLNREYAHKKQVVWPDQNLVAQFEKMVSPLFRQQELLTTSNEKLTQARDLLLPRLMDGRISA